MEINRCTDCNKVIGDSITVCPHCEALQRPNEREPKGRSAHSMTSEATWEKFNEINKGHESRRETMVTATVILAVVTLGLVLTPVPATAIVSFFGIFLTLHEYHRARWTSDEYYSLPGSRDASGKHRCIHCGKRGVFHRGQYKTSLKHTDCSKCEEHLFTE